MKVILKGPVMDNRVADLRHDLAEPWDIEVWNPDTGRESLERQLADAQAVVAMSWPADAPDGPSLKLFQLPGAGYDRVAFDRISPDAWVCNVFEHEIGIAEYVLGAMLEWSIGLNGMDRQLRQGDWTGSFHSRAPVRLHGELYGKTLGVIGYGHIGKALAARARPFGMRVVTCTRSPDRADDQVDEARPVADLDWLLKSSDFLVLACPLTAETTGLIGAAQFTCMKDTAVLINIARGPVVDEAALYDACRKRTIAGAVIDVWYSYPGDDDGPTLPSRYAFHELDNVIMTPHASGLSESLLVRRWKRIAENLDAVARGDVPQNVLRAPGGPPPL